MNIEDKFKQGNLGKEGSFKLPQIEQSKMADERSKVNVFQSKIT